MMVRKLISSPLHRGLEFRWKRLFSTAAVFVIWPVLAPAASIVTAETPKVEQLSGLPIFSHGVPLCTQAVTVCARALQPVNIAIGGTVTVRIADHYKSVYECRMINGVPTWLPTSVEGSCEAQPVIMLPAKYDAGEAWNVG